MSEPLEKLSCLGIHHGLYKNSLLFPPGPLFNIKALKWLKSNYEPTDNEILIVTYPKTGTTLSLQLCHQIMECVYNKTKSSNHAYYKQNIANYQIQNG